VVLFLRGYYNKHPKLWDEKIPYVQHSYNRALRSSNQCSPFETCFGYLPKVPLELMYGRDVYSNEEINEDRARKFIQRIEQLYQEVKEQLEKIQAQYKAWHDKQRVDHHFQVGDQVWLHNNNERLKGEGKKLNPIHYEPFTILEKRGANAFRLDIPPYMHIYLVVDVENLKYFDPPMIMDQDEEVSIPLVDKFSPEYLDELKEDINLDRRTRTSHRGDVDYLRVGLKRTLPSKAKWIEKDKVREIFPHLYVK
jgi:hypothetical protein